MSNIIIYNIESPEDQALPEMPFINHDAVVVVTGAASNIKYGLALAKLRKSPASLILFSKGGTTGTVMLSTLPKYKTGDNVDLQDFFK